MSMPYPSNHFRLVSLLSDGAFHSGEDLAKSLSITRTAVWKKIRILRDCGLDIHAVHGKGYRLRNPVECLDKGEILSAIPAGIKNNLERISIFEKIDSTNQYLVEKLGTPDFHAHAVLAEYQHGGRGRCGNSWYSPVASGIYLSLGWNFDLPPDTPGILSIAAGVAVIRALQKSGVQGAGLKWPNDIFWQDRKLGGILIEMRTEVAGPANAIIGVGLNYAISSQNCPDLDQPWTDLVSIQQDVVSRNQITGNLIGEILQAIKEMQQAGSSGLIDVWREYDCMTGREVRLLIAGKSITGMVRGIDADGSLLIQINGEIHKYQSGEITLRKK